MRMPISTPTFLNNRTRQILQPAMMRRLLPFWRGLRLAAVMACAVCLCFGAKAQVHAQSQPPITAAPPASADALAWQITSATENAARPDARSTPTPITVKDDRGRSHTFDRPPQRIVSLLPSLTESVCALGACERLVGVDRYSNYPQQVSRLPVVGGGMDPNMEAVAALRPHVVLAATSSRAALRLESLGIPVVAMDPQTHADVLRVLQLLEQLLQPDHSRKAQAVWQEIDDAITQAAQAVPPRWRQARVYFEVSRGPYAAGQASFIGQTLARLGLGNIVPVQMGAFPKLNPEFVLRADPDLIMQSNRSMQAQDWYPGWQNMRAIRHGQVCHFTQAESDVLVRPSPRMREAAALMLQCLQTLGPPAQGQQDDKR